MKPLYILKIGGSVATQKDKLGASVRKYLLKKIAEALVYSQKKKEFDLILIHGAGAAGHQLAYKYNLKDGINNNNERWIGSFKSRLANQELNNAITKTFNSAGLRITPIHTASAIIQKNKKISKFNIEIIKEALKWNCVPLLYGEMVFDSKLGMSICSGDAIAPYLAQKFNAKKIIFASDIDGIFDKDPHKYKNAKLFKEINFSEIKKNVNLTNSHNIDTTGGLKGKINSLISKKIKSLEVIEIFNGLNGNNFQKIILEKKFPHTKIIAKKDGPRPSRKAS